MNPAQRNIRRSRHGAAFLFLVVLVLLVVVGATRTLVIGEVTARRDVIVRGRSAILETAIERAVDAGLDPKDPMRFPVDPSLDHWIDVAMQNDAVTARWIAGQQTLAEVTRPVDSKPSNSDDENE